MQFFFVFIIFRLYFTRPGFSLYHLIISHGLKRLHGSWAFFQLIFFVNKYGGSADQINSTWQLRGGDYKLFAHPSVQPFALLASTQV